MVASSLPREFWNGHSAFRRETESSETIDFEDSTLARRALHALAVMPASHVESPTHEYSHGRSLRLGSRDQLLKMLRLGVRKEIQDSTRFLLLEDDWDGVGSPGYRQETWESAVDFVLRFLAKLDGRFSMAHDAMEFMPGSYGNIDVEIVFGTCRMLFSFPADHNAAIRFYARDDSNRDEIKGSLSTDSRIDWLIGWLTG